LVEAIDTHTHFVPRHIPAEQGRNPLWPSIELKDTSAAVMVGGKVFRIIDSRSWDACRRLDDMAVDDVDVQVVSPMPELLSHWFPADDADAQALSRQRRLSGDPSFRGVSSRLSTRVSRRRDRSNESEPIRR